jgi:NAD(P)-dependent dehydrogenase (short-subunit alcohol dehydrogenase family)
MGAFPKLPVLEHVVAACPGAVSEWETIGLVACQHLLDTTGSLLERIIALGIKPNNMFVLGKVYSTNPAVVRRLVRRGCGVNPGSSARRPGAHQMAAEDDAGQLWCQAMGHFRRHGIKRIIVLDDGGVLHLRMPSLPQQDYVVVGIEQTTFGMVHNAPIGTGGLPVINVASSAAKRHFEPPLIADAVLRRVLDVLRSVQPAPICGILGLGKIGLALAQGLRDEGYKIVAHDRNPQRLELLRSSKQRLAKDELLARSNFVFGCCGSDSLSKEDLQSITTGRRILASCSSSDVEFRSVLLADVTWQQSRKGKPKCRDLCCHFGSRNLHIHVLRSGYPVNFDNTRESVPALKIQLTRGLLLAAILQARKLLLAGATKRCGSVMLDPNLQQIVVQAWREQTQQPNRADDVRWYKEESQGSEL